MDVNELSGVSGGEYVIIVVGVRVSSCVVVVVRMGVCVGERGGDGKGLSDCVRLALGLCGSV